MQDDTRTGSTSSSELRYRAVPENVSVDMPEETIILNPTSGIYYSLAGAGALVWSHLATPRSAAELTAAVCAEYEVDAARGEDDVRKLLDGLRASGLVQATS